ncbi:unnamed protein product [Phytophthora fragariaefolia]|uniref:Unnamed protein product n=1 Tax=Phytophthora fragariaefolia TaxID=1490495 RepID=A0A9W7D998_9STRA|nr:unnamed protein product [Phytophthora fragariaefolia]
MAFCWFRSAQAEDSQTNSHFQFCLIYSSIMISASGYLSIAQQPGTNIPEKHPALPSQVCTKVTDVLAQVDQVDSKVVKCVTEKSSVVIDTNWRRMNAIGTNDSCNADSKWN